MATSRGAFQNTSVGRRKVKPPGFGTFIRLPDISVTTLLIMVKISYVGGCIVKITILPLQRLISTVKVAKMRKQKVKIKKVKVLMKINSEKR